MTHDRLARLPVPDRNTVRRIAEEICRERQVVLSRGVLTEAINLWFQGYRPEVTNAAG